MQTLVDIYNFCLENNIVYENGYASVPAQFKNVVAVCGKNNCDMVGKAEDYKINKASLYAKENFLVCDDCYKLSFPKKSAWEWNHTVNTCSVCGLGAHGSAFCENGSRICTYCMKMNRFAKSDVICKSCSMYQEKSTIRDGFCAECYKLVRYCGKCGVYHYRSEMKYNLVISGQHNKPSNVKISCKKKCKVEIVSITKMVKDEKTYIGSGIRKQLAFKNELVSH